MVPHSRAVAPRILVAYVVVPSREFQKFLYKIVAHSVK